MTNRRKSQKKTQKTQKDFFTKGEPKWKRDLKKEVLGDINARRLEYFFESPPNLIKLFGVSKRDLPLWHCLYNAGVFILIQLMLLPFCLNCHWIFVAIPTILRLGLFGLPRYVLALHFSSHLECIHPKWLNDFYVQWILAPFHGLPPGVYGYHHVVMHHREDNIPPRDLSSTMPYQRDNFLHFLHYWARFEFAIWVELPKYLWTAGYKGGCLLALIGVSSWLYANYWLWCIRPAFMLWVLFLPQFILSLMLMFGNFSQHIFIDQDDYTNDHLLTVNMINNDYNRVSFNDGYHILHHKYPVLHWSQLPRRFITDKEIQLHADAKTAVCFKGIDFWWLGIFVMTGQLKKLSTYFVPCSQKQAEMNTDQVVQFFVDKLRPVKKR